MTDTWNDETQAYTAIKMDVANIGSNPDSKLLDLKVNGVSKASIDTEGNLVVQSVIGQELSYLSGYSNILSVPATALPYEVLTITGGIGTGTGGTPGEYALQATGGPVGFEAFVTIGSDGKISRYTVINPGLSNLNIAPTLSLSRVPNLVGATTPIAVVGIIPVNKVFFAPSSDNTQKLAWTNINGTLTQYPTTGLQYAEYFKAGVDSSTNAASIIGNQVAVTATFIAQVMASLGRFYSVRSVAVSALNVDDLFSSNEGGPLAIYKRTSTTPFYSLVTTLGYAGPIGNSQLTQSTERILGRTSASTGAIEEITIDGMLSLSDSKLTGLTVAHGAYNTLVSGDYITPVVNATAISSAASQTGLIFFTLLRPAKDITIDRLETEVVTPQSGSKFHLGIYGDNGNKPDGTAVIAKTTTELDSSSAGLKNTGTEISATLLKGKTYWLALTINSTATSVTFRTVGVSGMAMLGSGNPALMTPTCYRSATYTYGPLPTTCPTTGLGTPNFAPALIRARIA